VAATEGVWRSNHRQEISVRVTATLATSMTTMTTDGTAPVLKGRFTGTRKPNLIGIRRGFVIQSGHDCATPILGMCCDGR